MSGEPRPRSVPSWYGWYATALLTAASALSLIDRQILSLMVGPVRRDLQISDTQMSLLMGAAFVVFYTLVTIPFARLADRYSRKVIITSGIAFWSIMTAACGLAKGFAPLFLARMGVGLGEATLSPAAYSILGDYFDRTRLPLAIGFLQSSTFFGTGFAYFVGGPLIDHLETLGGLTTPLGHLRSWQAAFFIVGVPGLLLALLIAFMREPPRTGRISTDPNSAGMPLREILAFVAQRKVFFALHLLGFLLMATQAYSLFAWAAEFFIRVHGFTRTEAGLTFGGIAMGVGILGSLSGGLIATALIGRGHPDGAMRMAFLKCVVVAPFAIAFGLVPDAGWAVALLIPVTFLMALTPGIGAAIVQSVAPNEIRGQMVALYGVAVLFLSYLLAPLLVALLNDYVFGQEAAVGKSLATVSALAYPAAALSFWLCLPRYQQALKAAEAWDRPA